MIKALTWVLLRAEELNCENISAFGQKHGEARHIKF